ncbi:MAG: hypothetical protein ACRDRU_05050 [Pseudonocardiaceae bacterium]
MGAEPYLPARGADLDGNTKHQRGPTITLCEPRTTGRTPLAIVAVIASAPPPAVIVAPPVTIRLVHRDDTLFFLDSVDDDDDMQGALPLDHQDEILSADQVQPHVPR